MVMLSNNADTVRDVYRTLYPDDDDDHLGLALAVEFAADLPALRGLVTHLRRTIQSFDSDEKRKRNSQSRCRRGSR